MPNNIGKNAVEFYAEPMNSIGYLTRVTFRAFSRNLERLTLPHGVSAGQWPFLRVLWNEEGLTQREISHRVVMRQPTTVVALDSLEESGFVRRVPSKQDRRKIHVFLTPKGRKLKKTLLPCVAEVNALAAAGVSRRDVEILRRVLRTMGANLARAEEAYLAENAAT